MINKILLLSKKGSRVMRIIAEIPPTPDAEDRFSPDHPYLRPHVFIEEAPI
jgi:hypothetical protein